MPQNSKKKVPRMVDRFGVSRHRVGHGLIDRFVKTRKILNVRAGKALVLRYPVFDDARPQGAIFGYHLINVETISEANSCVNISCALT
jgi:hypothetical protein